VKCRLSDKDEEAAVVECRRTQASELVPFTLKYLEPTIEMELDKSIQVQLDF